MRRTNSTSRMAIGLIVILFGGLIGAHAQGTTDGHNRWPSFEVAAIKLHDPDDASGGNFFQGVDRWSARNYTLRQLVRTAYQVEEYRIVGGPEWAATERYDIDAKASAQDVLPGPDGRVPSRLLMVRSLLAERFKLGLRQEQREMPVYELTVLRPDGTLGQALRPSRRSPRLSPRSPSARRSTGLDPQSLPRSKNNSVCACDRNVRWLTCSSSKPQRSP